MKRKITVTDFDGKKKTIEKDVASKDHLASQIKYPARVQKSKKTYTRKIKHKKNVLDSFFFVIQKLLYKYIIIVSMKGGNYYVQRIYKSKLAEVEVHVLFMLTRFQPR